MLTLGPNVGDSISADLCAGGETGPRWPAPPWKFGLRVSDDRGDV